MKLLSFAHAVIVAFSLAVVSSAQEQQNHENSNPTWSPDDREILRPQCPYSRRYRIQAAAKVQGNYYEQRLPQSTRFSLT